jgi:drug/metabolite transporter (DMT)-like permease
MKQDMNWIVFTILAILFRAIYSLATRVLSVSVKVSAITQSVLMTTLASLLSLILSPFLGGFSFSHLGEIWIPLTLMIVSSSVGNIIYFKGQEHLDTGTTQIAFSSIVIWGTFLSLLFLGSHFSLLQFAGILLLLCAIIMIQYEKTAFKPSPAILYILASAGIFAVFQVTSAQVSKVLPAGTALPFEYIGSTLLVAAIYWKKVQKEFGTLKANSKNTLQAGFFASGSTLLYYLFAYIAYSLAPDRGIVVLLLTTQVIVSVLLGLIFLKEREGIKRKLLAAIIAVAASIMIKA